MKTIEHGKPDSSETEAATSRAGRDAVHGTREKPSCRIFVYELASTSYDPVSRNLEARFTDGRAFCYSNVHPRVYEALAAAKSSSAFFDAFIRDHYSRRPLQP